jgi:hypothetical protein
MQIIAMMQAELTTCDPQMPNQCSAFTNGPCCPVTITPGTNTENYDQAVMAYKNQCMPQCGMVCATMPTNTCVPFGDAGTSGVCAQQ